MITSDMIEQIKQCKNNNGNINWKRLTSGLEFADVRKRLLEIFPNMNISEQVYRLLNNIIEYNPLCVVCQKNQCKFKNFREGYCETCSQRCSGSRAEVKQKRISTNIKKFGVENVFQSPLFQEKIKDSIEKKYGVSNISKSNHFKNIVTNNWKCISDEERKQIIDKRKKTTYERLGVEHVSQSEIVKQKVKETNQKNYGVDCFFQTNEFKKNFVNPFNTTEGQDAAKEGMYRQWGVFNASQIPNIAEKKKDTCHKKYGKDWFNQKHISDDSIAIIQNKEKFASLLKDIGVWQLSKLLNISVSYVYRIHRDFGLDIITPQHSSYEMELAQLLQKHNVYYEANNRKICNPKEIDIFIPKNNLAIEINGLYWHSDGIGNKNKNYHYEKMNKCAEQGIQLLQIFEDEWVHKADICKSVILHKLGIGEKIQGRKCLVKEIPNAETREFLDINHLQGWIKGSRAFVLEYNNIIVGAMTFGKPRYNKNIQWELLRLAFLKGLTILGGAEKLWKFALQKLSPKTLISYCDKRWFNGAIYKKLGFTLTMIGKPTYWYVDNSKIKRYHRSKFQKHKLVAQGYDINLTEDIIVRDIIGFNKIWDCGQDTWIWKNE
jgi:hypothetical protein